MNALTTTPTIRERLTAELFDNFGQGDTHRTNAIIDRVMATLYPELGPSLVREFAEWVVAFEAIPEGQRNVSMGQIITRAQQALNLGSDFWVEAGSTNDSGLVPLEWNEDTWDTFRAAGTMDLIRFAQMVVALDDPDSTSTGGQYRRTMTLRNLIYLAKGALQPPF